MFFWKYLQIQREHRKPHDQLYRKTGWEVSSNQASKQMNKKEEILPRATEKPSQILQITVGLLLRAPIVCVGMIFLPEVVRVIYN